MKDPTKTITLTNAETGEHESMSFSDASHQLGISLSRVVDLLDGVEMAEFTAHRMVSTTYLLKRIKQ